MGQRISVSIGVTFCVGNRGVGNLRFIGLVGLGPASRVSTFHLLDSLLTATTKISICPYMTSYSNIFASSLSGKNIVFAMKSLAFENYGEALKIYRLTKYQESTLISLLLVPTCALIFCNTQSL